MSPTDHEHFSELLPAYLDEALDDREAAWMTAHRETCAECRSELTGLKALRADEDSLNEVERARLHRDVLHELGLMTGGPTSKPSPWGQRAAQLLGVAATVVLLIGGIAYLGGNVGGGDDSAETAGGDAGGDSAQDSDGDDGTTMESGAGGAAPDALRTKDLPPPEATFESDLGTVEDRALKRIGRRSKPFTRFPGNVATTAVSEYRKPFLDDLVAQSTGDVSGQLRECATDVLSQLPSAVATYAAPARYGDPPRPVLIIGFAYSFTEDGFLDQYQLWIYPRGSCDFPTNYIGGQIRP
jgi:hypothetical protein